MTGAEKLMSDLESRVNEKHEDFEGVVKELESKLAEKSEEIMKMRESKRFSLTEVLQIGKKLLSQTFLMQNLLVLQLAKVGTMIMQNQS